MSMVQRATAMAIALLLGAGSAVAQAGRESLQRAWLREVLDVDPVAAAASYRQIVESSASAPTDRWVAAARLLELQALGVAQGTTIARTDLPQRLQERIREAADEQAIRDRLASEAERAPEQLPAAIRAEQRTSLRPFVRESILMAIEELRPGDRERRMPPRRSGSERSRTTTRMMQEWNAPRVLRVELAGQTQRADALRALYFPDWLPPAVPADHAATLQTVRSNLDQWRRERQLTGAQREALRNLSTAIDAAASRGPDDALRLLQRLPVYAERLLGSPIPAATVDSTAGRDR